MKILYVTCGLPYPPFAGSKIRDFQLLRYMARQGEVILCCLLKDEKEVPEHAELRSFCRAIELFRPVDRSIGRNVRDGLRHVREGRPLATYPFYFAEFAASIRRLALEHRVDLVQIEHSFLAPYRDAVPAGCPAILSLHNVGALQYAKIAELESSGGMWKVKALAMRDWEARAASRYDHCIAVSKLEAAWLRRACPGLDVTVVDNGVDCGHLKPLPEAAAGNDLLFVGALGYPPNADAVQYFVRDIFPLVRERAPDARLMIVGKDIPPGLRSLAQHGPIELHSDVPDVGPFYERARMSIVPLRAGGGTRLKILEAMALGRPVVSTSIGCEGLDVKHERDLLIADEPWRFADAVIRVMGDAALRERLSENGRSKVEGRYDWQILGERLTRVQGEVCERRRAAAQVVAS